MRTTVSITLDANMYERDTMFLRTSVGTATGDHGEQYEMSLLNGLTPCVRNTKTGKWFAIEWGQILQAAMEAGIDSEEVEDATQEQG